MGITKEFDIVGLGAVVQFGWARDLIWSDTTNHGTEHNHIVDLSYIRYPNDPISGGVRLLVGPLAFAVAWL
jgi:hypothetical protein